LVITGGPDTSCTGCRRAGGGRSADRCQPARGRRGIARALNARGVATARGGEWTAVQVGSILRRVDA